VFEKRTLIAYSPSTETSRTSYSNLATPSSSTTTTKMLRTLCAIWTGRPSKVSGSWLNMQKENGKKELAQGRETAQTQETGEDETTQETVETEDTSPKEGSSGKEVLRLKMSASIAGKTATGRMNAESQESLEAEIERTVNAISVVRKDIFRETARAIDRSRDQGRDQ